MKLMVTKDVENHKVNDEYECLLVCFEEGDKHFSKAGQNWMPKDDEVMRIIAGMLNISPTFKERFRTTFKTMMEDV